MMGSLDEKKLTELLLLLAEGLQQESSAGATKLNKLAFYADFTHMRKTGRTITGADYQRLKNGPAPRKLLAIRHSVISNGDATLREDTVLGLMQHRLVPLRPANVSVFDQDELETVSEVLAALANKSGSSLSEMSHQEPMWALVEDGDVIPMETAFLSNGSASDAALQRGRVLASRYKIS